MRRILWVVAILAMVAAPLAAQELSSEGAGDPAMSPEAESGYLQARVSLDVKDKPLRDVLQAIGRQAGINIILAPGIEDRVTETFDRMPWREALTTLLDHTGCLVQEETKDTIRIAKPPRVDMDFRNAALDEVISLLSKQAGANVLIAPQVIASKQTVTMRLSNVPWDAALEAVVKTAGFAIVREDYDIIRVVSPGDLLVQMETRMFQLRYVHPPAYYQAKISTAYAVGTTPTPVTDLVKGFTLYQALRNMLTKGKKGNDSGSLDFDPATNTLIATDSKPVLDAMEAIIKKLDVEPEQVIIESKLVTTRNSQLAEIGVSWGTSAAKGFTFTSSIDPTTPNPMLRKIPFGFGHEGPIYSNYIGAVGDAMSAAIRLYRQDTNSEIVQAPSIVALNHTPATIRVGESLDYPQISVTAATGSTSTSTSISKGGTVEQGFQLWVTPHIVEGEDKVIMTLIPDNTLMAGTTSPVRGMERYTAGEGGTVIIDLPRTTTSTLVTHMVLRSGETAIVGGLVQKSTSEEENRVPILGDIPFLGRLFRDNDDQITRDTLLIFVTPRIVRGTERIREAHAKYLKGREADAAVEYERLRAVQIQQTIEDELQRRRAAGEAEFRALQGDSETPAEAPIEEVDSSGDIR